MNVLLIGKGAREHALAWKIRQSPLLGKLFLLPGNPLSRRLGDILPLPVGGDFRQMVRTAQEVGIDLVVCGPEDPLADGLADAFWDAGIRVFGPRQAVARLESSKAFAKKIMQEAGIPTAGFEIAEGEQDCLAKARECIARADGVVIKASGLAAGKGVFVCKTSADVEAAVQRLYGSSMRSAAGTVVIEDILCGRECSYFTLLGRDGSTPLGFAVDFKRLGNQDKGPNTGGMGCYTPVPWLPSDAAAQVEDLIVTPLLKRLAEENLEYVGCLFVGIMWGDAGPQVIEFNVRFGDPEAEVLVVADERDWLPVLSYKAGGMGEAWAEPAALKPTVATVMASSGYPYGEGETLPAVLPEALLSASDDVVVFAGSVDASPHGLPQTGRGRVLTVVGTGDSLAQARQESLGRVQAVAAGWPKARWRSDIAETAVEEEVTR